MIRLTWIMTALALGAVAGHFGYLHFAATPAPVRGPTSVRSELVWLQRELDLKPSQLNVVRALHEEGWTRAERLRAEIEAERRNARVTHNSAACVVIEKQSKSDTATFIHRVTTVLTPAQRQKYLGLVETCLPPPTRTGGATVEQSPGR